MAVAHGGCGGESGGGSSYPLPSSMPFHKALLNNKTIAVESTGEEIARVKAELLDDSTGSSSGGYDAVSSEMKDSGVTEEEGVTATPTPTAAIHIKEEVETTPSSMEFSPKPLEGLHVVGPPPFDS